MKQQSKIKKMMPLIFCATIFFLSFSVVIADPTVELDPTQPKPVEPVSFTATIPNTEGIEEVAIRVQECGNEPDIGYICYTDEFNESMTKLTADSYSATITLSHENAIELKYQLKYRTEEGWTNYPKDDLITVDLDTSGQVNGDTNGNNEDGGSGTPGFEMLIFFISVIFISLIMYRRKR